MRLKFDDSDAILIDEEALRRTKPRMAIDLSRAPTTRKEIPKDEDSINLVKSDPLAAIIALARRKKRR